MKKKALIFGVSALLLMAGSASAASWATGSITGPNWGAPPSDDPPGPATAADFEMFDDGTHGDGGAGDGLYATRVFTLGAGDLDRDGETGLQWKATTDGWASNSPNDNVPITFPASGTIQFFWDKTPKADSYYPDAGSGPTAAGIVYTSADVTRIGAASAVEVVGTFQSDLGGVDFSATDATAVTLNAQGGGIYSNNTVLTGLTPGSYEWYIRLNNATGTTEPNIDLISAQGVGGSFGFHRLSFLVLDSLDELTFTLNANTVRSRVLSSNPDANPGPPFFAVSSAWGVVANDDTKLDAPELQVGGWYEKVFTVATPGSYTARVIQGQGRSFPEVASTNTIGYPFVTTAADQDVKLVFDRNTYTDGYSPASDFIVVLDDATDLALNEWVRVGVVGNFQGDFGGVDWTPDAAPFTALDGGAGGDVFAGDLVYALTLEAFVDGTDKQLRGVATKTGQSAYRNELGTPTNGLVTDGSNVNGLLGYTGDFDYVAGDVTFQLDTVTGRIGVGSTVPERASYATGAADVDDWMMY